MSEDKNELMDHMYDGIQEYDNPMPKWWTSSFLLTAVFAVLYVVGITFGQVDGYQDDMKQDDAENEVLRAAVSAKNPPIDDALLSTAIADAKRSEEGKLVFAANCASCHGAGGGGLIGPNLTDTSYLYGKKPMETYIVIRDGAPKGMPPWGAILSQADMLNVISYVVSIRGSSPENPKAAEGTVIK